MAVSFVTGIVGWFAAGFIGRPIRRFFDLRGEVIRRWAQLANVGARWKEVRGEPGQVEEFDLPERGIARLEEAQDIFRDLAAQMRSFAQNEPLAMWLLKRFTRYDPEAASSALFGVSNTLDTYGAARAAKKKAVEDALQFRD